MKEMQADKMKLKYGEYIDKLVAWEYNEQQPLKNIGTI